MGTHFCWYIYMHTNGNQEERPPTKRHETLNEGRPLDCGMAILKGEHEDAFVFLALITTPSVEGEPHKLHPFFNKSVHRAVVDRVARTQGVALVVFANLHLRLQAFSPAPLRDFMIVQSRRQDRPRCLLGAHEGHKNYNHRFDGRQQEDELPLRAVMPRREEGPPLGPVDVQHRRRAPEAPDARVHRPHEGSVQALDARRLHVAAPDQTVRVQLSHQRHAEVDVRVGHSENVHGLRVVPRDKVPTQVVYGDEPAKP
mmetsp:Transcript_16133/g.47008  ORF Transcript_16133/g.47008 Transcript_16133/m.47008 type:complete len:256 (+) Transcript_16133:793-1560(+)